jgi:hypothetical protein
MKTIEKYRVTLSLKNGDSYTLDVTAKDKKESIENALYDYRNSGKQAINLNCIANDEGHSSRKIYVK